MKRLEGGICAVPGVRASGIRQGKYGLSLIAASGDAVGLFTTNKIRAAPLEVTANHLDVSGGWIEGIIANSGCANAYTGELGFEDAKTMARKFAEFLNTDKMNIAVASTGVIGRHLDMGLISRLFDDTKLRLRNNHEASKEAALAIMTTDTTVKEIAVEHNGIRVAGIVKGAGMIEPNLATMLCFLFTDAELSPSFLRRCLSEAANDSFNMLTVDGDTSTNDMLLLTATGTKKCLPQDFCTALKYVCIELAKMMAKDGEGATKYFEALVHGAKNDEQARSAAKAIARSNLVKTAIYGADPNWGRIVAAVGRSGADVDPQTISLQIEGSGMEAILIERGKIVEDMLGKAKKIMQGKKIILCVDLGIGQSSARSFGCDLTPKYVDINASYTT